LHPALRITADVVRFRLRRLEMANLAGAAAIALTLHLPALDFVVRMTFAVLLNVLVYLNNDYCNVSEDLEAEDRDLAKTRFLSEHLGAARTAQLVLVAVLVAIGLLWSRGLLVALGAGGGICWAYSAALKRVPVVDVLCIMLWGLAMPLVGFPLDQAAGWCLAFQLALFTGVFEAIQVVRDRAADAAAGVRTTAVALGVPATRGLALGLILASAVYTSLVLQAWLGLLAASAALLRLDEAGAARYWNQVRLVFGITFLATCAWVFSSGGTDGLLLQVATDQRLVGLAPIR
jgi:4-hydroxybenzoate polyprenyltransferase